MNVNMASNIKKIMILITWRNKNVTPYLIFREVIEFGVAQESHFSIVIYQDTSWYIYIPYVFVKLKHFGSDADLYD